jgi:hypothetical protein
VNPGRQIGEHTLDDGVSGKQEEKSVEAVLAGLWQGSGRQIPKGAENDPSRQTISSVSFFVYPILHAGLHTDDEAVEGKQGAYDVLGVSAGAGQGAG